MPATAQARQPAPPLKKPQRLRDRHTTESDLLVEKRIQDTEILTLAHQIQTERYTALQALEKGDVDAVKASLDRIGELADEIIAAEKRDVGLNQQHGDILRLREQQWRDEA